MADVGVRELKARLSEYLERAARGEVIRVTRRGALILRKNDASGLPELDDALEITVFFPPSP